MTWCGRVIAWCGLIIWKWEHLTRGDNAPYMTRLTIFGCSLFKIMIHWFEDSDDECLHDHPWAFLSLILRGGYYEVTEGEYWMLTKWYKPWSILYRPATWKHRIFIKEDKKPVTLVITGWKSRSWGFWTPSGWIHWSKYSKQEHCP